MTPEHLELVKGLEKVFIQNNFPDSMRYITKLSVILEADEAALAQARAVDPNTPLIPVIIP